MRKPTVFDDAFHTPKGRLPHHYAAIGRLIVHFANIERALAEIVREVIGVSYETGNALTGEMRARDSMQMFVRVLDARRRDEFIANPETGVPLTIEEFPPLLEAIQKGVPPPNLKEKAKPPNRVVMRQLFSEIKCLNEIRDDIAHRHMLVRRREMSFSNWTTARTPDRLSFTNYSIDELNEMALYAEKLTKRLRLLLQPASVFEDELALDPTLLEIPPRLQPLDKRRQSRQERRRGRAIPPRSSTE
jgi:hypothetical protein